MSQNKIWDAKSLKAALRLRGTNDREDEITNFGRWWWDSLSDESHQRYMKYEGWAGVDLARKSDKEVMILYAVWCLKGKPHD